MLIFTNFRQGYYRIFETMLDSLNATNSESKLCIETFLCQAETNWYSRFHQAKLGKTQVALPDIGVKKFGHKGVSVSVRSVSVSETEGTDSVGPGSNLETSAEQFLISPNYEPPTGVELLMLWTPRGFSWPLYAYFMAFGQIVAVNSHQITILSGQQGESATKLYATASVYLAGSILWWMMVRRVASKWALSLPFLCYALSFFFVGLAPFGLTVVMRGWIQNLATGFYALASASGTLFFAFNFGSESECFIP